MWEKDAMIIDVGLTTSNKMGAVVAILLIILTLSFYSVNIYTSITGD